jgi:trehalose 6-phosphate phosphatase
MSRGRGRSAPFTTHTRDRIPRLFDCWENVSERIRAAIAIWIFLDFDGTLVPYYRRPEDVKLSGDCRRILERLSRRRRVRVKLLGLFGWEKNGRAALPRKTKGALVGLRTVLAPLAASFPGIQVEDKGVSYAVHFRDASPDAQRRVRVWIRGLVARLRPEFHMIQSDYACDIVPHQVQGKGVAMRDFVRSLRAPFLPIYIGDDLTDEPAFMALRRGITVRVGPFSRTKARFRLKNPEEVCAFLERLEEELL